MGSGSSKEKQPQPRKADASKPPKPQIRDNNFKTKQSLEAKNDSSGTNTRKGVSESNRTNGYNDSNNVKEFSNKGTTNGNLHNNGNKNLGKFESDSESEGEDINAVLEATKNEYNRSMQEKNRRTTRNDDDTMYPETYAQRLQREQYRNEPKGLIRQKTIYRNPDEWEIDDNEMESFDVSKFKQANVQNKPLSEQSSQLNRDIFSPNVQESKQQRFDYEDYERKKILATLRHIRGSVAG